jgi:hypothetical protein
MDILKNKKMATSDVCYEIVKPETINDKCSYADSLIKLKDGMNQHLVGNATVFVSHAWSYQFLALVEAIEIYHKNNNCDDDKTFYWYDCLKMNYENHLPSFPTFPITSFKSFHTLKSFA